MKHEYLGTPLDNEFDNFKFMVTSNCGIRILTGVDMKTDEAIEMCVVGGELVASSTFFGEFHYSLPRSENAMTLNDVATFTPENLADCATLLEGVIHYSYVDVRDYIIEGIYSHNLKKNAYYGRITDFARHFMARFFDSCLGVNSEFCLKEAQILQRKMDEFSEWSIVNMTVNMPRVSSIEDVYFSKLLGYVNKNRII